MTKVRKSLSVLLAVVLVLSTCLIGAFAAPLQPEEASFEVEVDKTSVEAGKTVNVTVYLTTNYNISATSAVVRFDAKQFKVVSGSVDMNKALFGETRYTDAQEYDPADGQVGAYFVDLDGAPRNIKANHVKLFSVQLEAVASASPATIKIDAQDTKSTKLPDGKLYCGSFAAGKVNEVGQKFDLANATKTVTITGGVPAEQPELICKLGAKSITYNGALPGAEALVGENMIAGIDPADAVQGEAGLAKYFDVKNGKLVWQVAKTSATFKTPVLGGTGTKLFLQNNSGETVASYTLILLGDLNGDAQINAADKGNMDAYIGGTHSMIEGYGLLAADFNPVDNQINGADKGNMDAYIGGTHSMIDQSVAFADFT